MRETDQSSDDRADEPTGEQRWPMQDFWPFVIKRIGIVGAVISPLFFVAGSILWGLSSLGRSIVVSGRLFWGLVLAVEVGVFSFVIAIIAAAIVAYVADWFLRDFDFDYETLIVGGLVGGAVGLLAMVFLLKASNASGFLDDIALGMIAATVIGQIGGAWGAWDSQVKRRASSGAKPNFTQQPKRKPAFQFSVRQLLVVTTYCAVVLAVMKLTGMMTIRFFHYFGVWLAVQIVGLIIIKNINKTLQRRLLSIYE